MYELQDSQGFHIQRVVFTLYLLSRHRRRLGLDERPRKGTVRTVLAIHRPRRNGSSGIGNGDSVGATDISLLDHASSSDV